MNTESHVVSQMQRLEEILPISLFHYHFAYVIAIRTLFVHSVKFSKCFLQLQRNSAGANLIKPPSCSKPNAVAPLPCK